MVLTLLPEYEELIPSHYPRLQGDVITLADDRVFGFQEYRFWHEIKNSETSSDKASSQEATAGPATEPAKENEELVVFMIPGLPGSRFFHHPDLFSKAAIPPFEDDEDQPPKREGSHSRTGSAHLLSGSSSQHSRSRTSLHAGVSHSRSASASNSDSNKRLVRLFVLERPGIGLSTFAQRQFLDFADDVREFCRHKNITRASLIAYSAGGPFGLAVAHALGQPTASPTESPLIVKAAIISSTAPHTAPGLYKNMPLKFKFAWFLAKYAPGLLARLANMEAKKSLKDPIKASRDALSDACPADREYFEKHPETERMFLESTLEMYTRGQVATECWEYSLWGKDWGFRLEEIGGREGKEEIGGPEKTGSKSGSASKIDVRSVLSGKSSKSKESKDSRSASRIDDGNGVKVKVWHGEQDGGTTIAMGKYIASHIPGCESSFVANKGHYLYFEIWNEVLDWIARA